MYRYFPDRTSLLRTLAERYLDDVYGAIGAELEGVKTREGAREALSAVLRSYHRAVLDDRALRQLWAGTLGDPVLAELSVADNLRNGRLIARHLAPFSPLEPGRLEVCCVLLANLAGAAVSLAVDVGGAGGDAYVAEFERCFDLVLGPG